ncbi:hypothetical protein QYE76_023957 [Lolium multiflorum]|uniref:Uncharacterized protein n=1 Tax=Lolium multiflorum TaxID=4521 RepID=A0AAD8VV96_LOLMU|nr:hypothetical protein QYE76_023957 [Lolium multiflorum]
MPRRKARTYSMLRRNRCTTHVPPPPEPERSMHTSSTQASASTSGLLDTQYEVDAEREAAEEEQELVADPQWTVILESCRLTHDQRNAASIL